MNDLRVEFGQYLAAARQKAGQSVEAVARTIKVAAHHVHALENGHIESLPTGVYRRALLRSYASAVGLDPHVTVQRFEEVFGPSLSPLGISGSLEGKNDSALWYQPISHFASSLRRVVGLTAGTAWQIVTLPIRLIRSAVALLARSVGALMLALRAVGRGAVRIVARAFTWTLALFTYLVPAIVALILHLVRSSMRGVPRRPFAFRVPNSVIAIPATIVLTAIVTTSIVTRQGATKTQPAELVRHEAIAAVVQKTVATTDVVKTGVGTAGVALLSDPRPVDTVKPAPVRRVVQRQAPAVAKVATSTGSRAARRVDGLGTGSRLVVTSIPRGARVTVNGIAWGVTPLTIRHLPPGEKVIRVTKEGYVGAERRLWLGDQVGTASVGLTLRAARR